MTEHKHLVERARKARDRRALLITGVFILTVVGGIGAKLCEFIF
jgi:hypothetical protein